MLDRSSLSSGAGPSLNCGRGGTSLTGTDTSVVEGVGRDDSEGKGLGEDVAVWNVSGVFRVELREGRGSRLRLKLRKKRLILYCD